MVSLDVMGLAISDAAYFEGSRLQGHSKSSMLIPIKCSSPVLVMISSMFEPISATVFTLDEPIAVK